MNTDYEKSGVFRIKRQRHEKWRVQMVISIENAIQHYTHMRQQNG